ncbi:MAG: hypothetical protein IJ767_08230 [Bacteroidaceae bacterium]|nr:hypothetical protein [Bacteroidaceae bacterium]
MTKEEFEELQLDLQKSGKPLMSYLHDAGVNYSTYTYWRRKLERASKPQPEIAPISFLQSPAPPGFFTGDVPCGATLLFPNGLRAHFGSGTEDVLRELLDKSLMKLLHAEDGGMDYICRRRPNRCKLWRATPCPVGTYIEPFATTPHNVSSGSPW